MLCLIAITFYGIAITFYSAFPIGVIRANRERVKNNMYEIIK